jgi:Tol biopolymer transport system component
VAEPRALLRDGGAVDVLWEGGSPISWSPDGRFVLYARGTTPQTNDLWVLPLFGDRKPFPLVQAPFANMAARFSPDGPWVAYSSDESGRFQVYVVPFPGPGGKWQISTAGGQFPRWAQDGKEIFFLAPDNNLIAATVSSEGSGFEVGAVRLLFQTHPKLSSDRFSAARTTSHPTDASSLTLSSDR